MQEAQRRLSEVMGRAASRYDLAGPPFFTDVAERLLQRVEVGPGADVLDVATGPGSCSRASIAPAGESASTSRRP